MTVALYVWWWLGIFLAILTCRSLAQDESNLSKESPGMDSQTLQLIQRILSKEMKDQDVLNTVVNDEDKRKRYKITVRKKHNKNQTDDASLPGLDEDDTYTVDLIENPPKREQSKIETIVKRKKPDEGMKYTITKSRSSPGEKAKYTVIKSNIPADELSITKPVLTKSTTHHSQRWSTDPVKKQFVVVHLNKSISTTQQDTDKDIPKLNNAVRNRYESTINENENNGKTIEAQQKDADLTFRTGQNKHDYHKKYKRPPSSDEEYYFDPEFWEKFNYHDLSHHNQGIKRTRNKNSGKKSILKQRIFESSKNIGKPHDSESNERSPEDYYQYSDEYLPFDLLLHELNHSPAVLHENYNENSNNNGDYGIVSLLPGIEKLPKKYKITSTLNTNENINKAIKGKHKHGHENIKQGNDHYSYAYLTQAKSDKFNLPHTESTKKHYVHLPKPGSGEGSIEIAILAPNDDVSKENSQQNDKTNYYLGKHTHVKRPRFRHRTYLSPSAGLRSAPEKDENLNENTANEAITKRPEDIIHVVNLTKSDIDLQLLQNNSHTEVKSKIDDVNITHDLNENDSSNPTRTHSDETITGYQGSKEHVHFEHEIKEKNGTGPDSERYQTQLQNLARALTILKTLNISLAVDKSRNVLNLVDKVNDTENLEGLPNQLIKYDDQVYDPHQLIKHDNYFDNTVKFAENQNENINTIEPANKINISNLHFNAVSKVITESNNNNKLQALKSGRENGCEPGYCRKDENNEATALKNVEPVNVEFTAENQELKVLRSNKPFKIELTAEVDDLNKPEILKSQVSAEATDDFKVVELSPSEPSLSVASLPQLNSNNSNENTVIDFVPDGQLSVTPITQNNRISEGEESLFDEQVSIPPENKLLNIDDENEKSLEVLDPSSSVHFIKQLNQTSDVLNDEPLLDDQGPFSNETLHNGINTLRKHTKHKSRETKIIKIDLLNTTYTTNAPEHQMLRTFDDGVLEKLESGSAETNYLPTNLRSRGKQRKKTKTRSSSKRTALSVKSAKTSYKKHHVTTTPKPRVTEKPHIAPDTKNAKHDKKISTATTVEPDVHQDNSANNTLDDKDLLRVAPLVTTTESQKKLKPLSFSVNDTKTEDSPVLKTSFKAGQNPTFKISTQGSIEIDNNNNNVNNIDKSGEETKQLKTGIKNFAKSIYDIINNGKKVQSSDETYETVRESSETKSEYSKTNESHYSNSTIVHNSASLLENYLEEHLLSKSGELLYYLTVQDVIDLLKKYIEYAIKARHSKGEINCVLELIKYIEIAVLAKQGVNRQSDLNEADIMDLIVKYREIVKNKNMIPEQSSKEEEDLNSQEQEKSLQTLLLSIIAMFEKYRQIRHSYNKELDANAQSLLDILKKYKSKWLNGDHTYEDRQTILDFLNFIKDRLPSGGHSQNDNFHFNNDDNIDNRQSIISELDRELRVALDKYQETSDDLEGRQMISELINYLQVSVYSKPQEELQNYMNIKNVIDLLIKIRLNRPTTRIEVENIIFDLQKQLEAKRQNNLQTPDNEKQQTILSDLIKYFQDLIYFKFNEEQNDIVDDKTMVDILKKYKQILSQQRHKQSEQDFEIAHSVISELEKAIQNKRHKEVPHHDTLDQNLVNTIIKYIKSSMNTNNGRGNDLDVNVIIDLLTKYRQNQNINKENEKLLSDLEKYLLTVLENRLKKTGASKDLENISNLLKYLLSKAKKSRGHFDRTYIIEIISRIKQIQQQRNKQPRNQEQYNRNPTKEKNIISQLLKMLENIMSSESNTLEKLQLKIIITALEKYLQIISSSDFAEREIEESMKNVIDLLNDFKNQQRSDQRNIISDLLEQLQNAHKNNKQKSNDLPYDDTLDDLIKQINEGTSSRSTENEYPADDDSIDEILKKFKDLENGHKTDREVPDDSVENMITDLIKNSEDKNTDMNDENRADLLNKFRELEDILKKKHDIPHDSELIIAELIKQIKNKNFNLNDKNFVDLWNQFRELEKKRKRDKNINKNLDSIKFDHYDRSQIERILTELVNNLLNSGGTKDDVLSQLVKSKKIVLTPDIAQFIIDLCKKFNKDVYQIESSESDSEENRKRNNLFFKELQNLIKRIYEKEHSTSPEDNFPSSDENIKAITVILLETSTNLRKRIEMILKTLEMRASDRLKEVAVTSKDKSDSKSIKDVVGIEIEDLLSLEAFQNIDDTMQKYIQDTISSLRKYFKKIDISEQGQLKVIQTQIKQVFNDLIKKHRQVSHEMEVLQEELIRIILRIYSQSNTAISNAMISVNCSSIFKTLINFVRDVLYRFLQTRTVKANNWLL